MDNVIDFIIQISALLIKFLDLERGRLFEVDAYPFLAYRVGAYSWWALIRGWALNQINTAAD